MTTEEAIALCVKVEANHQRYEQTEKSSWRFIPFWVLRKKYAIIKENERIMGSLGVKYEALWVESEGSWLLKKLIGVKGQARNVRRKIRLSRETASVRVLGVPRNGSRT